MDLHLIRTFLEVCQTRHFGHAAENLHLTGSAVSARIKTLEEQLGAPLFFRLRKGIELTPTAERLITQFRSLLLTWDQVKYLVAESSAPQSNLTISASPGVWESLDPAWIRRLSRSHGDVRLRLEAHNASEIFRRLQQGTVEFGLTFEMLSGPEIVSRKVGELVLKMMSDIPGQTVKEALASDYLHVDWSTFFTTQFHSVFPEYVPDRITVTNPRIAAKLLTDFPGAAYLSHQLVENLRPSMELHPVEAAPEFRIPVFASYAVWTDKTTVLESAIELLSGAEIS